MSRYSWSQENQNDTEPKAQADGEILPDTEAGSDDRLEALEARLEAAEDRGDEQREENKRLAEEVEGLKSRLTFIEDQDGLDFSIESVADIEQKLDIYGFMDVNFFVYEASKKNTAYGLFPQNASFTVNRLNLYLASKLTQSLSVLAEIRFTFLPQGAEDSFTIPPLGMEYERRDNTVLDQFTVEEVQLGGIVIERAYLQWKPFNWFGVRAGRYLTPYGIWNVDHGSPVIIPVRPPYFLAWRLMPSAQTGVEIFGRGFPFDNFYVDYAVTLSNGRGPTETVYDLNDNKAVGLRLKASYDAPKVGIALGGYLYLGETTDITKEMNSFFPPLFEIEKTEEYKEITGAIDLKLRIYGFLLQSEYLRGKVEYKVRPLDRYPFFDVENVQSEYQPDHIKWATYGLLGYRYNFETPLGEMSVMPFGACEYTVLDDTVPELKAVVYRAGINFSPSGYVTLKYEGGQTLFPYSEKFKSGIDMHAVQVAVSF